ncbi:hypothetical protein [Aliarcobacter butzleri]|uniref:hypothetical protein n=1 Tax=Aliarcobacter butzleri TaxID=28197 RepID=UPI002B24373D|nr:hypothetical protein [Aliarcobacter butzleri]
MSLFSNLHFLQNLETTINEDFNNFEEKIQLNISKLKEIYTKENLRSLFDLVTNDKLLIFIDDLYDSSKLSIRSIEELNQKFDDFNPNNLNEEDEYIFRLQINKLNEFEYKIYSFQDFLNWLTNNNTILSIFDKFRGFETKEGQVKIHILDEENHFFYTNKFIFYSNENFTLLETIDINRNNLYENYKNNCHHTGINFYKFLPTDFKLIQNSSNQNLNELFNKVCFLLVLIYIVNISEFSSNTHHSNIIKYKLDGYRTIKNEFDFLEMNTTYLDKYYKIFIWIYLENTNSNISDKIGLSRNVISLHTNDNDILNVSGDIYSSIKSNFDIYLKENVQRYLEVKNQVSNFMYDMSLKAESYSSSFADIFKTNILIFLSYFLSMIVVTAIDKGKFINMFSTEVTTVTLVILTISFFYKKLAVKELNEKIDRFKTKYQLLKKRYSDILEEENLNNLFTNDVEHDADVEYMNKSLDKFNKLWIGTIIAFSVVSISFWLINNFKDFIEILVIYFFSIIGLYMKIKFVLAD